MSLPPSAPRAFDPARQRAAIRRTVWICVAVVAVLLGIFLAEHLL